MGRSYSHFTYTERALIYWLRRESLSLREIARRWRRSPTSISRELRRNLWCGRYYYPPGTQWLYGSPFQERTMRPRLKSPRVRAYVQRANLPGSARGSKMEGVTLDLINPPYIM